MRTVCRQHLIISLTSRRLHPPGGNFRFQKSKHSILGVIARCPRSSARDKPHVASALVKFHTQVLIPARYALYLVKHCGRQERVVVRAQQQRRPADGGEEPE